MLSLSGSRICSCTLNLTTPTYGDLKPRMLVSFGQLGDSYFRGGQQRAMGLKTFVLSSSVVLLCHGAGGRLPVSVLLHISGQHGTCVDGWEEWLVMKLVQFCWKNLRGILVSSPHVDAFTLWSRVQLTSHFVGITTVAHCQRETLASKLVQW
eukprot:CAMPEP_0194531990 /NCGR_PEP_ID=MMETSP0253-20130528/69410_1 /TAXON_ID=2966 /ORGANISM="Noctiluca scintillans" /LENGTH=151 /DNA_ID=CAMNT_0039377381 /DNA_START=1 /DNA_END=456 /DNA_ORIENTATION=+